MKYIFNIIFFMITLPTLAYPIDENGVIIIPEQLSATCIAKGDVTAFVYQYRDNADEEQMLKRLKKDWDDIWSKNDNIKFSTYVDMQRIVRDAYRRNSDGEFIRDCCTEEVTDENVLYEVVLCLHQSKY